MLSHITAIGLGLSRTRTKGSHTLEADRQVCNPRLGFILAVWASMKQDPYTHTYPLEPLFVYV